MSTRIEEELWRKSFVTRFLEDIFVQEPAFVADILFTKKNHNVYSSNNISFSSHIAINGNASFVRQLQEIMKNQETKIGLISEVKMMTGGAFLYDDDFKPTKFFLPDDYNQTSSLEQWTSQKPLGYQTIFQFEGSATTSSSQIQTALERTLMSIPVNSATNYSELVEIHQWNEEIGHGCILVSLWSEGSIIVLWDGKLHVDFNLFLYEEELEKSRIIQEAFTKGMPTFSIILRDEQPRGTGRVVNFVKDTTPFAKPHWA